MSAPLERMPVAYVRRRNGAWLIQWVGVAPHDWPSHERCDCASSLVAAKRIARGGAKQFATRLRWEQNERNRSWVLLGVEDERGY